MARGLLWLGLVLLGALQAQAQDSSPSLIPVPSLTKIPLQSDFDDDGFQGKWYVIGVAGNGINKKRGAQVKMYASTYQLIDDRSYVVTSTLVRNEQCDRRLRNFVPDFLPGKYTLGDMKGYAGMQSYDVQIMSTNYYQFAMVFFKKVQNNKEYFKIVLYGRTKQLTDDLKAYFTRFAKFLHLTDDHILFFTPTDKCIDDE